jgi:tektin-3
MNNYLASDKIRSAAERLRSDTLRMAREKEDLSLANQRESDKKLGERCNDIDFWKQELEREKDRLSKKINQVENKRRDVEKQLHDTENQLKVAQENLYEREKRQGIDVVHDNVERELIREIDTIKNSQMKLRQMLERLNTQNSLNRASLHELELDSADKFRALSLDSAAHHMTTSSRGLNFHLGIEHVDNTVATPDSWMKFTEDNIRRSASERIQSDEFLNMADNLLKETANDMWNQFNTVNEAFEQRIHESQTSKDKIQNHLSAVIQEIFDLEKSIEFIKKAVLDKESYLRLAQSRLETRTRRPGVELTRDQAMHRLIQEIEDLHGSIQDLKNKLALEENAIQHLLRTKATLEQDLSVKNNSIHIDKERCLGNRRTYPSIQSVSYPATVAMPYSSQSIVY